MPVFYRRIKRYNFRMSRHHDRINDTYWRAARRIIFDRAGWRCQSCGKSSRLECDHITPMDRGGAALDLGNLQALCRGCHIEKTRRENRRTPSEDELMWDRYIGELLSRATRLGHDTANVV